MSISSACLLTEMEWKLARPPPRRRIHKIESAEDEGRGPHDQRDHQRDKERGRGEWEQHLSRAQQQRDDGRGQVTDILLLIVAVLCTLLHSEGMNPSGSDGTPLLLVMQRRSTTP